MSTALTLEGHEASMAPDGMLGMEVFHEFHPELVVTDLLMPEQEGIQTIRKLREVDSALPAR